MARVALTSVSMYTVAPHDRIVSRRLPREETFTAIARDVLLGHPPSLAKMDGLLRVSVVGAEGSSMAPSPSLL